MGVLFCIGILLTSVILFAEFIFIHDIHTEINGGLFACGIKGSILLIILFPVGWVVFGFLTFDFIVSKTAGLIQSCSVKERTRLWLEKGIHDIKQDK
jgi:hypothetical protein